MMPLTMPRASWRRGRIARIVAHLVVAEHERCVVHAHGQRGVDALEGAHHVDEARVEMGRLLEVAVGQHIADAGMHEVGA